MRHIIKASLLAITVILCRLAAENTWPLLPWDDIDFWSIIIIFVAVEITVLANMCKHPQQYSEM